LLFNILDALKEYGVALGASQYRVAASDKEQQADFGERNGRYEDFSLSTALQRHVGFCRCDGPGAGNDFANDNNDYCGTDEQRPDEGAEEGTEDPGKGSQRKCEGSQ
jgi:hypothetical protein